MIMRSDDGGRGQDGTFGVDVSGFVGGLLNGVHLFLATGMIQRTDDDGLS